MAKSFVFRPTLTYCILINLKYIFIIAAIILLSVIVSIPSFEYLSIIPLAIGLYNGIYYKLVKYEVSPSQIKFSRGILNYKIDFLEMYRVKDLEIKQTLLMRIFNIMHFYIKSSDKSHPLLVFKGIPQSNVADVVRDLVERSRTLNRVYEID